MMMSKIRCSREMDILVLVLDTIYLLHAYVKRDL